MICGEVVWMTSVATTRPGELWFSRIPSHLESPDYPFPEVRRDFQNAVGKIYSVDAVDWGGWVSLRVGRGEGIGVQPDCVELVPTESNSTQTLPNLGRAVK